MPSITPIVPTFVRCVWIRAGYSLDVLFTRSDTLPHYCPRFASLAARTLSYAHLFISGLTLFYPSPRFYDYLPTFLFSLRGARAPPYSPHTFLRSALMPFGYSSAVAFAASAQFRALTPLYRYICTLYVRSLYVSVVRWHVALRLLHCLLNDFIITSEPCACITYVTLHCRTFFPPYLALLPLFLFAFRVSLTLD